MPQVLVDLIEACLGEDNTQQLADIVLRDAALSAKIILAASKTSSKPLDPLGPVSSAIQKLGIPMIIGIALQASKQIVRRNFTPQELSFQHSLWFSSQLSSLVARCLAPSVNYPHVEEAQLSGLLLNLGIHALFAQEGSSYIDLDVNSWSSVPQCHLEEVNYKINHLQIADMLIEPWQLDSFLADAIRFLHAESTQVEQSGVLLKIARLALHFCQDSQRLTIETEALAERLFGFNKSEVDYLFDWASGLYPPFGSFLDDSEKLQAELTVALDRLTELSFVLADQVVARARLGAGKDLEELAGIARNLYLENSSATEVFFFLLDQKNLQLTGIQVAGQPRLIGELKIPMEAKSSLISAVLLSGSPADSFQATQPLTVTDHLLLRLCKSRGMSCHPFNFEGRALGVVVLGIESSADSGRLQSLRIKMFGQLISAAMMQLLLATQEHFNDGSNLLRRVSHEVNNPLTIIGNYAGVLNQLLADNANRQLTESIKKEVKRIDDIINYYLNKQEIPEFPEYGINLNQLVRDTVDSLNDVEFEPRQIVPKFDLQSTLDKMATNPVLVKQVLVNLLKNAAEAVDAGGMVQIVTRDGYSSDRGKHVEIIVRDNGSGIDPQLQEKLFQPVTSSKGVDHAGVGLSIVKGMVDDLGGWISYHTSVESGTSFHLQLPCGDTR
ncbi:MAG: HDOD domain-containing protein [Desulfuromusa sp.]|nr:HDOD domain-containing protein [Desulfuromusa sp.]